MHLKSCPRCGGDLYEEPYRWGTLVCCVQCGYEKDVEEWKKEKPASVLPLTKGAR